MMIIISVASTVFYGTRYYLHVIFLFSFFNASPILQFWHAVGRINDCRIRPGPQHQHYPGPRNQRGQVGPQDHHHPEAETPTNFFLSRVSQVCPHFHSPKNADMYTVQSRFSRQQRKSVQ